MKNDKSVKQLNGKRLKIQKRLLLINIKELYDEYKKKYSSVGAVCKLSVFFENRPAYVINVGASGIHSVCVCLYHQNVKLMLDAAGFTNERHYLMDKLVCLVYNKVI
jgi:hypothetical protein